MLGLKIQKFLLIYWQSRAVKKNWVKVKQIQLKTPRHLLDTIYNMRLTIMTPLMTTFKNLIGEEQCQPFNKNQKWKLKDNQLFLLKSILILKNKSQRQKIFRNFLARIWRVRKVRDFVKSQLLTPKYQLKLVKFLVIMSKQTLMDNTYLIYNLIASQESWKNSLVKLHLRIYQIILILKSLKYGCYQIISLKTWFSILMEIKRWRLAHWMRW